MFKSIQMCRGGAALLVVAFHASAIISLPKYFGNSGLSKIFGFGHAGVIFFFVLSGFIIVYIHQRDFNIPARVLPYLKKRFQRVYPIYWFVFAAVFGVAMLNVSLRSTLPLNLALLLKAVLLVPQDPAVVGGTGAPVIIVAWSLQYEMVFYMFVALLITNQRLGVVAILSAVTAASYSWLIGGLRDISFLFNEYPCLFLLGGTVAIAVRRSLKIGCPLFIASIGMLGFIFVGVVEMACGLGQHSPICNWGYGLCSMAIVYGLVEAEKRGDVIGDRALPQWMGNASYAIYLVHFPLISLLSMLLIRVLPRTNFASVLAFLVFVSASVIAGLLLHVLVERPLANRLSGRKDINLQVV